MTKITKNSEISNQPKALEYWVIKENFIFGGSIFGLLLGSYNNRFFFLGHHRLEDYLLKINRIGTDYCEVTGQDMSIYYKQFLAPEDWSERDGFIQELIKGGELVQELAFGVIASYEDEKAVLNSVNKEAEKRNKEALLNQIEKPRPAPIGINYNPEEEQRLLQDVGPVIQQGEVDPQTIHYL